MSGRKYLTGAIAVLSAAMVAVGCSSQPTDQEQAGTIRFAVTDLQGLEELQREFGAFETELEKHSGLNIEFFAVNDRTAAAAALAADRVDVVFTGPAEYVVIHERSEAEPLVAIERDGYSSCVYTRADSGITSLDQLRDQKIAMTDVGSTSGHLGPSQILKDAGLDPITDLQVLTVGDAVHQALKRGDVAAVGAGCHDYNQAMAEDNPAEYRLLVKGENLPPDLLVAREGLDPEASTALKTAFEEHFPDLLNAMLEGKDNSKFANAKLVEVTDHDYDRVRSMYQAVGVNDFSQFLGE